MTDSPLDPTPTRRRRLRYSLRTLLVLFLVIGIALGLFTSRLRKAGRQREAVRTIVNLSGMVVFDDEPADLTAASARKPAPQWLSSLLGKDFFHTAVRVMAFNDASMVAVADLPEVRRLDLVGSSATDEGLIHVRRMRQLRVLNLADSQISDAGLEYLTGLTKLEELDLRGTQLTADAVARLQQALPNCRIQR